MNNEANTKPKKSTVSRVFESIILISLLFIIILSPLLKGLYFSSELYFIEVLTFVTYILFWVNKIVRKENHIKINFIDIAMLLFIVAYAIAFIFSINHRAAIQELVEYFVYFALFNMISDFIIRKRYRNFFAKALVAAGTIVCILGFDGAGGSNISRFLNEIFNMTRIPVRFYGLVQWNRIQSTLQYSNALAGFVTGLFFVSFGLLAASKKRIEGIVYSVTSYLFFGTLIYTYSRAAYVIFIVAAVFMLFIIPKGNKIRSVLYFITIVISNAAVSFKVSSYIQNTDPDTLKFWLFIILGAIINVVLFFVAKRTVNIFEKLNRKVYYISFGALLFIVFIGIVVLLNYKGPLVIDRTNENKDSVINYTRTVKLDAGKEYKLIIDDEVDSKDKSNAYTINVVSKTERDILSEGSGTKIGTYQASSENDNVNGEIYFKVPENSKIVQINIISSYAGTKVVINELNIADGWTGKKIKEVPLDYKLIPQRLQDRLDNFAASKDLLQRLSYYKDGLEMYKDHWLIGAGGGAWALLYGAYQNYYYVASEAHNYLLQVGVESGILGIISVLLLMISLLLIYRRYYKLLKQNDRLSIIPSFVFTAIVAMFLHSMVDFDFSIPALYMYFWILIAMFSAYCKAASPKTENDQSDKKIKISDVLKNLKLYPVIGLCVSVLFIIMPSTFAIGAITDNLYYKYADTDSKKAERILKFGKKIDFTNPMLKSYYINLHVKNNLVGENEITEETLNEIRNEIEKIEKAEKNNPDLLPLISSLYYRVSDFEKANEYARLAVEKRPYFASAWHTKISTYYQTMLYMLSSGNGEEAYNASEAIVLHKNAAQITNKDSIIPVMFDTETIEMMEVAKYIYDNAFREVVIDPDKVAFYNFPEIDEDGDSFPDTWNVEGDADVNLLYESDVLLVRSHLDISQGYSIKSRNLNLTAGKTYKIELVSPEKNADSINYSISGLTDGTLNYSEKESNYNSYSYVAEFTTPADFKNENNSLVLHLQGDWDISKILILEQ